MILPGSVVLKSSRLLTILPKTKKMKILKKKEKMKKYKHLAPLKLEKMKGKKIAKSLMMLPKVNRLPANSAQRLKSRTLMEKQMPPQ